MIAAIIERLRATCGSLASVQGAEDMEALSKGVAPPHGAAFVLPFRDRPRENERLTGHLQQIDVEFLTVFVIRKYGDAKGGERVSDFDRFKDEIEAALAGWLPGEAFEPVSYLAGQAGSLGTGATFYVQTWATGRLMEG